MKYLKRTLTRLGVTACLIVVQACLVVMLLEEIVTNFPVVAACCYGISVLIVLALIKKEEAAAYKIIWIIIVMALPLLGGVLYLLFQNNRPLKKIRRRMDAEKRAAAAHLSKAGLPGEGAVVPSASVDAEKAWTAGESRPGARPERTATVDPRLDSLARYVRGAASYPVYDDTETKYYPFGELMFEDMLAELSKAEKFIFMEYFIISHGEMWDRILALLTKKAEEGVDVRLIFDDLGSLKLFTVSYVAALRAKGIKVIRFSPILPLLSLFMNNRDHRKIMVIDGHTGFNGGINIGDEYINKTHPLGVWKDTGIMLKGGAVRSLMLMFAETWNVFCGPEERIDDYAAFYGEAHRAFAGDGMVLPYGDSPLGKERLGENVYIEVLNRAERYAYIFTPYLIASEKMLYALQMAAKRGVDVRIVTPGIPDKKLVFRMTRSYYRSLQDAGVRIYEYTPGFLHAKNFVSDDRIAVVGTINLDYRSLYLHFECATLLLHASAVEKMKDDAIQTMAESREILLGGKRRFVSDLVDAILRLLAPLM